MIGYNVIQPNGRVLRLSGETPEERQDQVRSITDSWKGYCDQNWISSNSDDQYCPENKVKVFLNGLGYFLILGDTEGIETDYKKVVHGSRELPMSSCPSYIEDAVYGNGSTIKKTEDIGGFENVLEAVDAKTERLQGYYKKPPAKKPKAKVKTRFAKFREIAERLNCQPHDFVHASVDTNGMFAYGGCKYLVSAPQYTSCQTQDGDDYYMMDRIICADGLHFFDMSMNEVSDLVKKL